ncbi:MAG TPA: hypothetical protein VKF36_06585 [Syntrophorhabdales bacterium]|nr:hypothetical protein [Syntrophorhabdales bacterium]
METVSIVWGSLPVLFLVMVLVMVAREERARRRNESPVNLMARIRRPAAGREPSGRRRRGTERSNVSTLFPDSGSARQAGPQRLKPGESLRR